MVLEEFGSSEPGKKGGKVAEPRNCLRRSGRTLHGGLLNRGGDRKNFR